MTKWRKNDLDVHKPKNGDCLVSTCWEEKYVYFKYVIQAQAICTHSKGININLKALFDYIMKDFKK